MDRKIFINSNDNKNRCGFLLIDIIVGITLFMGISYYCLFILTNNQILLQSFIKNSIEFNTCIMIGKNIAYRKSYYPFFIDNNDITVSDNYSSEIKQITFLMNDEHTVAVELVIVKSNTTHKAYQCMYYISKEI